MSNNNNNGGIQRAIKIYARLKPPFSQNRQLAQYDIIGTENADEEYLTIAVKQNPDDGYVNNKPEHHSFRFSKIFDRMCPQEDIFENVAKPVIDSALLGYNGTIFAYGQTGSGKTHTMTGSRTEYEKRGIIPRTLSYVFRNFQDDHDSSKIRAAFVSYLEIYNEGGYDLLHSSDMAGRLEDLGKVTLLEDGHQQMHLRNLSVHPINSEEEALQLLYLGDHNRTVAETPLNEASTRSHCIFTIHLNIRESNTSIVRRSKLHLVDLAGSERCANSPISGQLLTEARHINLALHYLEQVIVALSDSNRQHIPYRNSMMTSVLRDSLGGNCMTSMIATLSIEPRNVNETLSTCRFAQRVAMVTNAAMPNEELDPNLVIQTLKAEVKRLRETIATSSVKPMKEAATPLTQDEITECASLVDRFLIDPDSKAILPVSPDMRMVQGCFRLLKGAYNSKRPRSFGMTGSSKSIVDSLTNPPISRPRTEMSPQELLQTINRRDIEIKVLVEMLRKEKMKRGGLCSRESLDIHAHSTKSECEVAGSQSAVRKSVQDQLEDLRGQNEETTEMSEVKKLALSEFLETYDGRGRLEEIRTEILRKTEEVEMLQNALNSNDVNMGSLSDIYNRTKAEGLSQDSENIKTALESQERTYIMQTKRLENAKKELDAKHEMLKIMYRKLMTEFESWWQNAAKGKPSETTSTNAAMKVVSTAFKQLELETMEAPQPSMNNALPNGSTALVRQPEDHQRGRRNFIPQRPMSMASSVETSASMVVNAPPPSPWSEIGQAVEAAVAAANGAPQETSNNNNETIPNMRPEEYDSDAANNDPDFDSQSVPLTGDPVTDNEILKFFKARKKAALKVKQALPQFHSQAPSGFNDLS